jgi:hypothetical protein
MAKRNDPPVPEPDRRCEAQPGGTVNDNLKAAEARRRAMELATWYRNNYYPLPLDIPFPGLRVHVVAEKIVGPDDTLPVRIVIVKDEDDQISD